MSLPYRAAAYLAAGALAIYALAACSPAPRNCAESPSFLKSSSHVIREHFVEFTPTYDLIAGDNCIVGTMTRDFLTFTRNTRIEASGKPVGSIDTRLVSIGYDMTVRDADGNVINTADHKVLNSLLNFGGFYIEIKDSEENLVATLKQDPFALWSQAVWKQFDLLNADGEVIASIEYTNFVPDTYSVKNAAGKLDNRTLAGIVGILDQLEDEMNSSNDSKSSNKR